MNLREAETLAITAMRAHGLNGWHFKWNNRKTALGVAMIKNGEKTIQLSRFLTEHADRADVIQTIGHEIAHAIVGVGKGHGPEWRAQMRSMGLKPTVQGEANAQQKIALASAANYVLTCTVNGKQIGTLNRIVKQRRIKRGGMYVMRKYDAHTCKCHHKPVLYNGRHWEDIS